MSRIKPRGRPAKTSENPAATALSRRRSAQRNPEEAKSYFGRPPRQPGHRPHRKHGQAMGGMNLEDFLAGGGGGMAMAAMGGLLLSMALGDH